MPKLEYFLVSQSISVDRDSNEVSVFNILEEMLMPKSVPAFIPQLVVLSSWIIEPKDQGIDFQVDVEVTRPTEEGDKSDQFTLNFTGRGTRQRTYLRFEQMPIERDGDVTFNLKLNSEHKATHVINVRRSD